MQDNTTLLTKLWGQVAPAARTFIACTGAIAATAYYLGVPRLVEAYSVSIETRIVQDQRITKLIEAMQSNNKRDETQDLHIIELDKRVTKLEGAK
jgi:hypothetical protein